jgi:hypothetical protein
MQNKNHVQQCTDHSWLPHCRQRVAPRLQQRVVAAAADAADAAVAGDAQQQQQGVSVRLRKPVGIVFAQNKSG